jgi:hypothetical protein
VFLCVSLFFTGFLGVELGFAGGECRMGDASTDGWMGGWGIWDGRWADVGVDMRAVCGRRAFFFRDGTFRSAMAAMV